MIHMRLMAQDNYNEIHDKARDWFNFGIPKCYSMKLNVDELKQTFKWNDTDRNDFVKLINKFRCIFDSYCRMYCSKKFSPVEIARINATLFPMFNKTSKFLFSVQ